MIVTAIMITMMIPGEAIMIPLYVVNKDLHLINTLTSLIMSGLVSGFSILLIDRVAKCRGQREIK